MKTAVLIPCYNEETTIRKVVSDFKKMLPDAFGSGFPVGSSRFIPRFYFGLQALRFVILLTEIHFASYPFIRTHKSLYTL